MARVNYYDDLVQKLEAGESLLEWELRALAFAYAEDSVKPTKSLDEIEADETAKGLLQQAIDQGFSERDREQFVERAEEGGVEAPGITAEGLQTAGIGAAAALSPALLARLGGSSTVARLLGGIWKHKGKALLGGSGLVFGGSLFGAGGPDDPTLQTPTTTTTSPPPTTPNTGPDPSASQVPGQAPVIYMTDPETGSLVPVSQNQLGAEFQGPEALGSAGAGNFSPDLQNLADQAGVSVTGVSQNRNTLAMLDPNMVGDVRLKDPINFQFNRVGGFTNRATAARPLYGTPDRMQEQADVRSQMGSPDTMGPNVGLPSRPEMDQTREGQQMAAEATAPGQVTLPAGAEINPKVSQQYDGKTLMEWAAQIAHRNGVPLNLLYGLVNHESGWNPVIQGDNGQSHGLVQIYQPVWGDSVSIAQSRDPVFALNWAAREMRRVYDQYGRWDVAVANHNSPVAAQHLAKTGEFLNSKSKNYVSTIFGYANRSGLDDWKFDASTLSTTGDDGLGSDTPAFVTPDPATLRQFIRESYSDIYRRQPTQEELEKGVARLNSLYRSQFDRSLAAKEGVSGSAVDPGAQFVETLEQSGEGQFGVARTEQRSFMDFASEVARMIQSGL